MKLGKKLITTLFSFSAIGGVSAVASLGLTNCGTPPEPENPENIGDIVKIINVGISGGSGVPTDNQIWDWVVEDNPDISSTDLQFEKVDIINIAENSCDVVAKPHSGFTGTVHLTYNTTDPTLILWMSVPISITINLTQRYVGEATIDPQTSVQFNHYYSFDFIQDDGTQIDTPSKGGADTGYHFNNLQEVNVWGYWTIESKCIRFLGSGQYPGLNIITFDVCRDTDNSVVISMELDLTYQRA